jgi:MtN3 and saliva related transmembrane protein
MIEKLIPIIGIVAACCTTLSFLPQAIKIIKTKNTEGISLSMYVLFVIGVVLWFFYGFFKMDIPIMLANGITLVLASVILCYKVKYP